MNIDEVNSLKTSQSKEILHKHLHDDPSFFALSYKGNTYIPARAIAEQIACYKKAEKKLPTLSQKNMLYESTALQQSSSEATAYFKQSFMSGKKLIDCTGGLGIDSIALSNSFEESVYCEKNPVLAELFSANCETLSVSNIELKNGDSIELLKQFPDNTFDWLYIDPARRDANRRYVGFSKCEPDILPHLDLFLCKASNVCIKASPAFEISEAQKQLKGLYQTIIVSVNGECKEILFLLNKEPKDESPLLKVVMLASDSTVEVEVERKADDKISRICTNTVGRYFYDPDPAVIKARCSEKVAEEFCLSFVNNSVDYLASERCVIDFPGRIFEVVTVIPWNRKQVKQYLKENGVDKANVARRDFPLAPDEIKEMLKLSDGGDVYLFFTRDVQGNQIVINCKKTNV